jgi:outer membrane assembly lipoprotein YfiO
MLAMTKLRIIIYLGIFLFWCFDVVAQVSEVTYVYNAEELDKAIRLYDTKLISLSERKISDVIKKIPENPANDKALMYETKLDLVRGNFVIAETKLQDFVSHRSNSPFIPIAYFRNGMLLFRQGKFETSAYYLDKAYSSAVENYNTRHSTEEHRPDDEYYTMAHHSLYWKGIAESQIGKRDDAILTLQQCASVYPEGQLSDDAIFAYGQLYEQEGESEKAIAAFKRVRIEYPRTNVYVASLIREANNYLLLRKYPDALLVLERANFATQSILEQDSVGKSFEKQTNFDNPQEAILYLRGEASNLAGNYDQALMYFETFLNTFFGSALEHKSKLGAGWALLNLGQYDKAMAYFDDIIKTTEDTQLQVKYNAQLYRAVTLVKSGDIEKAKTELDALSLSTSFPFKGAVMLELGQIYYKEANYEKAKEVLERAEKFALSEVTLVRINLLLGATYMELANWGAATSTYDKAIKAIDSADYVLMPKKDWYLSEARFRRGVSLVMGARSGEAIASLSAYIANAKKDDPRNEEALFWLAEANYSSGLLNNAAISYEKLLKDYPYHSRKEDILYSLGWSYFRMKNFRKSGQVFEQLLEEFPKSKYAVEVLVRQADGYHMIKSYSKAAEYYKRAADRAPKTPEGRYASFQRADALYRLGSYEQSLSALQEFVRVYGNSSLAPNAMYLIGWIKFQQRKYEEAVANFNFLIERYPNSGYVPRAYYAIADCYYNKGDFEQAMSAYKTVVNKFPSSSLAPEAMRSIQQCLILLGREDEAISVINDYVEKNQDSPFTRSFRSDGARILFDSKKYDKAIDEYEKIIKADPNNVENAEMLYWIGKSYISLGKKDEAEKAFVKVQNKYPNSDYASLSLMENALMQKGSANAKKADSLFKSLIELYPNKNTAPRAVFERALMNFTMGDTAFGLKMYDYAVRNYPGDEYSDESAYRLANYYKRLDSNAKSREYFILLANNTKSDAFAAESYYRIGELWKKDKQLDSAEAAYMQVKNNYSGYEDWFSLSLLNLGEIYEQTEKYLKAKEIYSALLELRPSDDYGKTAKARIERVNKALEKND